MLEELKGQRIVVPTHSPFSSPVWPVCKPKGKWRLTIDYCGLHANPDPLTAAAPNIAELIASVQEQAHPMRASIDGFYAPLQPEDRECFAFIWEDQQFT